MPLVESELDSFGHVIYQLHRSSVTIQDATEVLHILHTSTWTSVASPLETARYATGYYAYWSCGQSDGPAVRYGVCPLCILAICNVVTTRGPSLLDHVLGRLLVHRTGLTRETDMTYTLPVDCNTPIAALY